MNRSLRKIVSLLGIVAKTMKEEGELRRRDMLYAKQLGALEEGIKWLTSAASRT